MKKILLLILVFLNSLCAHCQDSYPAAPDLHQLSDEILGLQDGEANYEEQLETLTTLVSNPLNLNKATSEEIRFVRILSESQISAFIQYREHYGNLLSIHELQSIPEFDIPTIKRLLPYVTVTDPASTLDKSFIRRILHEKNNYLLIRSERTLEQKQGFDKSLPEEQQFKGSPNKTYVRFRTSRPGDFSMGFTGENDAGESLNWNPGKTHFGVDFLSFHLQFQNKGNLKNIVVGDFQLQAGQGLVAGNSFSWGKGAETIMNTRKSNLGILPYTSSVESGYLRGTGITYQVAPYWQLTGFCSHLLRDAIIQSDSTGTSVSSFQTTGFHRNENELATKNSLMEDLYGGVVNYMNKNIDAGIIFQATSIGIQFDRTPSVYNQFTNSETTNYNASFFINYSLHNFTFFSEAAENLTGGTAIIAGLLGSLSPQTDISIVYRNYARNYYSPYANAFGESSLTQNERGLYWGLKYQFNKKNFLTGYVDLFSFPWLRYRSYAPANGHEWLLRFSHQLNKGSSIVIQTREENKARNASNDLSKIYHITPGIKRNYLLAIQYGIPKRLRFRTRVQASTFNFNYKTTNGFLLAQDIRWDIGRFTLTGRYTLFETDDYDNRLYAYEDDVQLAFSIPSYDGMGVRNYVIAEFKLNTHISCWIRYAHTRYQNQNTIGSGLDMINGNQRRDVKVQFMIKL